MHEIVRPDPSTEERARNSASRPIGAMAARAATLDFRKVGVTTWKVRVRIGLVYDFSDIKTLRKYIQDGRVTSADVISHDGKSWKPIGDIPDLDAFFVETWERLEAARADAPPEAPKEPTRPAPEPAPSGPSIQGPGPQGGPFVDPFLQQRQRTGKTQPVPPALPPARTRETPSSTSRNALLAVIVLALLLTAVALWLNYRAEPAPLAAGTLNPATSGADGTDYAARMRDQIDRDLRQNPADPAGTPVPAEPGLQPVRPPQPNGASANGGGTVVPDGAQPVRPRSGTNTAASVKQQDANAADHEAVGDDAAARSNWPMAVTAYSKAAAMDGKSARLQEKLGRAQYSAGDVGSAQVTLQRASKLGSKDAWKYLGHIARDQGDVGGATGYYSSYLKTSPRDAAEIETIIRGMSGG